MIILGNNDYSCNTNMCITTIKYNTKTLYFSHVYEKQRVVRNTVIVNKTF